jgi:trimeric autotransporter adhesin
MPVHSPVLRLGHPVRRAAALLGLPVLLAGLVTCTEAPTPTGPADPEAPVTAAGTAGAPTTMGSIPLPVFQSVTASGTAFGIIQSGLGHNGYFLINNPGSNHMALQAVTSGTGRAGEFRINNTANTNAAVRGTTKGTGPAGDFEIVNTISSGAALQATTNGEGPAGSFLVKSAGGSFMPAVVAITQAVGSAGEFSIFNPASKASAFHATTFGAGSALQVNQLNGSCTSTPTSCNLAVFKTSSGNQIRFGLLGRGYFNGGTQTGGADVAEAFQVEGRPSDYEPGDVLVISTRTDQRVERSQEPYSRLVVGVYATKPGVLLTERHIDANLDDTVPLGVVGVIPTKVTAENGRIRRGDLLVTARTPGHAMLADPERLRIGTSLGKALEGFAGPGRGRIRVLVNVK